MNEGERVSEREREGKTITKRRGFERFTNSNETISVSTATERRLNVYELKTEGKFHFNFIATNSKKN